MNDSDPPKLKRHGMRTSVCTCFAMFFLAVPVALADPPKLVGEAVLMEMHSEFYGIPWILRLSPDGELLLSWRRAAVKRAASPKPGTAADSRPKYGFQVFLHEWKTEKDKVIPIPLFSETLPSSAEKMYMNHFSADGRLLVVQAGIDEDGDGMVGKEEKVEPAVYAIESGNVRRIGVRGDLIFAAFDTTGKHLILTAMDKQARTYVAPIETLQPKALTLRGIPMAPRPGAPTCVFGELIVPSDGEASMKLVLYDYVGDARAVDQPFPDWTASVQPRGSQWTADGRYLYLTDWMEPITTYVWDVQEGKQVARLPECLAIGPCGGPTTMVLSRSPRAVAVLHDARSNSQEPLSSGSTAIHPISTAGKYLLYDCKDERGRHIACRAEIKVGHQEEPKPQARAAAHPGPAKELTLDLGGGLS